jgi:hypothetical protein
LIIIIVIHAANIHDIVGAREVKRSLKDKYLTGIQKIFSDGGYPGELIEGVLIQFGCIAFIQLSMIRLMVNRISK